VDKLRIVLVGDHEVVQLGLRSLLARQSDLTVVGEAETVNEAVQAVESLAPDVVVLDIRLPGRSGVEACAEIKRRRPETKIVMPTSYADDEVLFAGLSEQEFRVLALVTEGKTNRKIGETLHLSEKTVRNYVSDILTKLGHTSRAQAAAYAARHCIEDYF
jgi:two-component system response regulator DevR